jgi:hypothetical protein
MAVADDGIFRNYVPFINGANVETLLVSRDSALTILNIAGIINKNLTSINVNSVGDRITNISECVNDLYAKYINYGLIPLKDLNCDFSGNDYTPTEQEGLNIVAMENWFIANGKTLTTIIY